MTPLTREPLPLGNDAVPERERVLAGLTEDQGRRLRLYADLVLRWQPTINLVSNSTLPQLWTRHIGDSLQVADAVPAARRWLDLGSGGGFPGLVTAILVADAPGAQVHLVESDKRKAAFLRTVARETGVPAFVHAERIEHFAASWHEQFDAVSARALAPLPRLLDYAGGFLLGGATGVFPRGDSEAAELTGSELDRRFRIETVPSRFRDGSSLFLVRAAGPGGDHGSCRSPER